VSSRNDFAKCRSGSVTSRNGFAKWQSDSVTSRNDFAKCRSGFVTSWNDFAKCRSGFVTSRNDFAKCRSDSVTSRNDFAGLKTQVALGQSARFYPSPNLSPQGRGFILSSVFSLFIPCRDAINRVSTIPPLHKRGAGGERSSHRSPRRNLRMEIACDNFIG
jgi:hypothetical protein